MGDGNTGLPEEKGAVGPCEAAEQHLEYEQIAENLRAGVTVLWDAFKTYFTVIGLMLAACAFLLSKESGLDPHFSAGMTIVVSVLASVITFLARKAILQLVDYQRAFLLRGKKLERVMKTRTMRAAGRLFFAKKTGFVALTLWVFWCFLLPWFLLIGWSVYILWPGTPNKEKPACCEAPGCAAMGGANAAR